MDCLQAFGLELNNFAQILEVSRTPILYKSRTTLDCYSFKNSLNLCCNFEKTCDFHIHIFRGTLRDVVSSNTVFFRFSNLIKCNSISIKNNIQIRCYWHLLSQSTSFITVFIYHLLLFLSTKYASKA